MTGNHDFDGHASPAAATDRRHTSGRSASPCSVFVVDDSQSYLEVVRVVIEATAGFELIGSAASRDEAVASLARMDPGPDLLLLDVNLGEGSGIDVARVVTGAGVPTIGRVLLTSTLAADELPLEARTCGASGFLPKIELGTASLRAALTGAYDWS
jgi:DNA-binding NarL/FixJ family response regulator